MYYKNKQNSNEATGNASLHYSEELLDIRVSQTLHNRAVKFFKSLIAIARRAGYDVETTKANYGRYNNDSGTFFIVKGEKIKVDLVEHNFAKQVQNGSFLSRVLVPSGELKFRIYSYFSWDVKEIRDTKFVKLEDKIDNIIHSLEVIADKRIEEERQRKIDEEQRRVEEERKRREEEERKQKEALSKKEREKVISLLIDVERYDVAKKMNDYIQMYKKMLEEKGIELTDEIQSNVGWMQEKADWMNPFINVNDEILTDDDFLNVLHPKEENKEKSNLSYEWMAQKDTKSPKYNYWQLKNSFWREK